MFASLSKRVNSNVRRKRLHGQITKRRIPGGVCQTVADRYDTDSQLIALDWFTEVNGTKIGRWPVYDSPEIDIKNL